MIATLPRKVQLSEMFLRVKQLRESHKLTQSELAKITGIAEGTIKAWESGRVQDLTLDAVRRLAPAYGMTPETLTRYLNATLTMEPEPADGANVQFSNARTLRPDRQAEIDAIVAGLTAHWAEEDRKEAERKQREGKG